MNVAYYTPNLKNTKITLDPACMKCMDDAGGIVKLVGYFVNAVVAPVVSGIGMRVAVYLTVLVLHQQRGSG